MEAVVLITLQIVFVARATDKLRHSMFFLYKPACLQKKVFHVRVLSIRVFYSDVHFGLSVSFCR